MEYKRVVRENTASIEHLEHIYICSPEEKENVLEIIKATYPNASIELIKNGYKVREIRQKSQHETSAWLDKNVKNFSDDEWEHEINKLKGTKK